MTIGTIVLPEPAAFRSLFLRLSLVIGVAALAAFFGHQGWRQSHELRDAIRYDYRDNGPPRLNNNDFLTFYTGAEVVSSHARSKSYDMETMVRRILQVQGYSAAAIGAKPSISSPENEWLRYYNPPLFLLASAPLTLLSLKTAYLIAVAFNVGLICLLMVLLGFVLRWRQPHTLLLLLALTGYAPLAFTVRHVQPTALLAVMLAAGYLALRNGRVVLAGLLLALTGVKPHWLLLPLSLIKSRPRLIVPFFAGCVLFLALPFALLGPKSVIDYVQLILSRGDGDLTDAGYTTALLSWAGFFRALTGEARPDLWLLASLVTLGAFAVVFFRSAEPEIVLPATTLTALLVVPHSHPQDWLLVAPAAAMLLSLDWRPVELAGIGMGILGIYLGANDWTHAQQLMDARGHSIYWVSIAAFGLLAWLSLIAIARQLQPAGNLERESDGLGLSASTVAAAIDAAAGEQQHGYKKNEEPWRNRKPETAKKNYQ